MSLSKEYVVFAGTYAPAREESIHVLKFDAAAGRLVKMSGVSGVDQPSFLAFDEPRNRLYAVSELEDGAVVSFRYDPESGTLEELNRQPTHGAHPCHLRVDRESKRLVLVNYSGGSVNVYPLEPDGAIGPLAQQIAHEGSSVNTARQEKPHPHSIFPVPDKNKGTEAIEASPQWIVPDLGTDKLYLYELDEAAPKLRLLSETIVTPGAGPRHAEFHPQLPIVYIIDELSSTVSVYEHDRSAAKLTQRQQLSTLPADFTGANTCADIHIAPSGRLLYGSNRGHDSIAVFDVLPDGTLAFKQTVATEGRTPRNFALVPGEPFLLAANQDSDSIVVFRIADTGELAPTGERLQLAKPVCLQVHGIVRSAGR
ncbi:lactonase family protein [Paenibacillus chartarius]|uniref:Lactonase family protein n=1 Tax=Paenibacillus chartarius TaxID=747481 RepID=A0ABV6DG70_9BACL